MNINEQTREYVRQHATDDVRQLALQGTKDQAVDMPVALQQIAGRQTARRKLPSWAAVEDVIYPPHLNMEQCSSEMTAQYKAKVVSDGKYGLGDSVPLVDLTGGFGIDFYWMAKAITYHAAPIYVEQNAELCAIAEHNFRQLGLPCSVCCCDAVAYLKEMAHAAVVYLDPARRNEHGGRTYSIADCTPNVLELMPLLMEKADCIILKLSPMLDWRKAVSDLQQSSQINHPSPLVSTVHIVSVDNECKELIVQMNGEKSAMRNKKEVMTNEIRVVCVNLMSNGERQVFEFVAVAQDSRPISHDSLSVSHFLYEPNASIMKAGCFAELEGAYPVQQVAVNSHLFLSPDEIGDFPGRRFEILSISSMNKKELSKNLVSLKSANIAVRNFPMTAEQLRKKLKMKDGGDTYLFATTLADGQHCLFICRK